MEEEYNERENEQFINNELEMERGMKILNPVILYAY